MAKWLRSFRKMYGPKIAPKNGSEVVEKKLCSCYFFIIISKFRKNLDIEPLHIIFSKHIIEGFRSYVKQA